MQVERFIHLGRISSQNKSITVKVQRELAGYVIGTHQTMTQSYPEWAEFSKKWEDTTLDQHLERARNSHMDYDKVWVNRGHAKTMNKVYALLTKTHWYKVKLEDGFFEEVERVVPEF